MDKQCQQLVSVLDNFRRTTCKMKPTSLSHSEFITLITIQDIDRIKQSEGKEEGVKVSEISARIETSKPDVSKKISLLEEKQLVYRQESKKDKRVTFIQLTEKGLEEMERCKREVEEFMTNVLKRMGEEDANEFFRLCKQMQIAMEEEYIERKRGK